MIIDLRSDTVTKPTQHMLEAMMQAEVGDDVFREDETMNQLEKKMASLFNKDTALFFPSGTMANQTAIKLHTKPGDQVICDKYAHIYNYESGGVSFNSGVSCKLIDGYRGMFTAEQVVNAINPDAYYYSKSTLVEIENTTNKGGGACWDFKEIMKISKVCRTHNLGFHLDGARLWHTLVEKKESLTDYGNAFDTISVCLSKGLGCPVGSILIGNDNIMEDALRIRKVFGGNMRQVGYLAAAGLYALDHHIERLADDHRRAKEIGQELSKLAFIRTVEPIETNIVIFELERHIDDKAFVKLLEAHHVHIINMGDSKLRMVTHLDYDDDKHNKLIQILRKLSV
ncbi:PLP-dependent transferase [Tamlana fucoidanivorans]|uniref:Threonine aldolase n=1 Tax=Allotamlana fucoidanivorans TaxID=2583814 RepID=A0A5C4SR28_9FLAO|nr:GntG family PLP-dependent aldolase [Tamlana fucoidanivorans]TNJ46527.1 threonine aldolase [Tamlana fucoidanivorans]